MVECLYSFACKAATTFLCDYFWENHHHHHNPNLVFELLQYTLYLSQCDGNNE